MIRVTKEKVMLSSMNSLPKSANTKAELWNEYKVVITKCEEILAILGHMHLPETKPRVLELTDAGPGVGCSNIMALFSIEWRRQYSFIV